MFIIYGTRTDLKTDAELQPVQCENCGHFAPQMLFRKIWRFMLFHIPTFGFCQKRGTMCKNCGKIHPLKKRQYKEIRRNIA